MSWIDKSVVIITNITSAFTIGVHYAIQAIHVWLSHSKIKNWDRCTIKQLHHTILDKNRIIARQRRTIDERNKVIETLMIELNRINHKYGYC